MPFYTCWLRTFAEKITSCVNIELFTKLKLFHAHKYIYNVYVLKFGVCWVTPLSTPYSRFISQSNHCYRERNVCLNNRICKCMVSNKTNNSNCPPLEAVDRGSETQLQVGDNLSFKCSAKSVNGFIDPDGGLRRLSHTFRFKVDFCSPMDQQNRDLPNKAEARLQALTRHRDNISWWALIVRVRRRVRAGQSKKSFQSSRGNFLRSSPQLPELVSIENGTPRPLTGYSCQWPDISQRIETLTYCWFIDGTRRLTNAPLMLGPRLRRWPNIKPAMGKRPVYAWI